MNTPTDTARAIIDRAHLYLAEIAPHIRLELIEPDIVGYDPPMSAELLRACRLALIDIEGPDALAACDYHSFNYPTTVGICHRIPVSDALAGASCTATPNGAPS